MNTTREQDGTKRVGARSRPDSADHGRILSPDMRRIAGNEGMARLLRSSMQAAPLIQRRAAPYIKKISVNLSPPQSAVMEWEGTPPDTAPGVDSFTVSTGKGYSDPGDPAGTCTRDCCADAVTQCAPPWDKPGKVGACCTYTGDNFWTGVPLEEHNTWKWWTPVQPHYSKRGIALHQHTEVTGQPIGHGCIRMEEPNAKRIYSFSNGTKTKVAISGRASPVACADDRRCSAAGDAGVRQGSGANGVRQEGTPAASATERATDGLEGEMS